MGHFNQKLFKELLRKGIGTRTQKEFANQTGITPATINRMLNDDTIPCPKVKTLETFASKMSNVTLAELLEACGYDVPTLPDVIRKFESDTADFFAFEHSGLNLFSQLSDVESKLRSFLGRNVMNSDIQVSQNDIPSEMAQKGAEEASTLKLYWVYDNYACCTTFDIYYTLTSKQRVILIGSNIESAIDDEKHIGRTSVKKHRKRTTGPSAEERLLTAIFGPLLENILPTTYVGYGFYYEETPSGFVDFLHSHADTFCDSKENIALYQRIVNGENPDEVFVEYYDEDGETGTGVVVADIMYKETGNKYLFYQKDSYLSPEEQNSCVMLKAENNEARKIPNPVLIYLFECAKTLQLKQFGMVYYRTTCIKENDQCYETDAFWLHKTN